MRVCGRQRAATAREEFELEERLFDKDKWCLFRPTGGCKGKIRTFAGWKVARSRSAVQQMQSRSGEGWQTHADMAITVLIMLLHECLQIHTSAFAIGSINPYVLPCSATVHHRFPK